MVMLISENTSLQLNKGWSTAKRKHFVYFPCIAKATQFDKHILTHIVTWKGQVTSREELEARNRKAEKYIEGRPGVGLTSPKGFI